MAPAATVDSDLTFAQTVMSLRLDGCIRDLVNPAYRCSLTELATHWGFYDLSHLNRAFRAREGCLPSEYQAETPSAGMLSPKA